MAWNYQVDPLWLSIVWGRVGAAVLILASVVLSAFGYVYDVDAQASTFEAVSAALGALGAVLAIVSKVREGKKVGE